MTESSAKGRKLLRENQIFVHNLSFDVKENDLLVAFESFGPIKHVSVALDGESKSKGFGFVTL